MGSVYYWVPDKSIPTSIGLLSLANVASPPSPLKLANPVPAIVVTMPVDTDTLRMRLFLKSAMYTLPIILIF